MENGPFVDAFPIGKGGCSIRYMLVYREGKRATTWLTSRAYYGLLTNRWFPFINKPNWTLISQRGVRGPRGLYRSTGQLSASDSGPTWGIGSEPFAWIPTTGGDGALSDEEMKKHGKNTLIVFGSGYIWDHLCHYTTHAVIWRLYLINH